MILIFRIWDNWRRIESKNDLFSYVGYIIIHSNGMTFKFICMNSRLNIKWVKPHSSALNAAFIFTHSISNTQLILKKHALVVFIFVWCCVKEKLYNSTFSFLLFDQWDLAHKWWNTIKGENLFSEIRKKKADCHCDWNDRGEG